MLPALRIGKVYRARVVALLSQGRVRLDLRGQRIVAQVRTPLHVDQQLLVEVAQITPSVELRIRRARQEVPGS